MRPRFALRLGVTLLVLAGLAVPLWSTINVSETLTANYHRFKVLNPGGQEVDSHELGCAGQPGVLCMAQRAAHPTSPPPAAFPWQLWSTAAGVFLEGPTGGPKGPLGAPTGGAAPDVSVRLQLAASQQIPTGGALQTAMVWAAPALPDTYQDGGPWWVSTAATEARIPSNGKYAIVISGNLQENTTGTYRRVGLRKNGSTAGLPSNPSPPFSGTNTRLQLVDARRFAANDRLEVIVFHNATTALTLNAGADTFVSIYRFAP
jgi:hypothetical protein